MPDDFARASTPGWVRIGSSVAAGIALGCGDFVFGLGGNVGGMLTWETTCPVCRAPVTVTTRSCFRLVDLHDRARHCDTLDSGPRPTLNGTFEARS